MEKSVSFCTLGCKVNQYETNAMKNQFLKAGFKIMDFSEKSDIYVVNTCTVTNVADRKSRQMLRRGKELNKDAIIVACGCYAQSKKEELLEKVPEVDIVLGVNEKSDILQIVLDYMNKDNKEQNKEVIVSDVMTGRNYKEFDFGSFIEKTRATIKVQDGCDRFCTYCAIPFARGRVRSRDAESTVKEVENIAKAGIKEVVITGIHMASYGKDFMKTEEEKKEFGDENGKYLLDLLTKINAVEGIERIRISSLEPRIITESFMEGLSKLEKICHHFHLSLQSGTDTVLKRMNRKYTVKEYEDACDLLRKYYNDVKLTTDIIVGFPGETEEEFNETKKYVEKINFYKVHVFEYSRRSGTVADKMDGQIEQEVKKQRAKELIAISDRLMDEQNEEYIGKEVEVLFEEEKNGYIKGHTSNYMVVNVKKDDSKNINIIHLESEIKKVKIEERVGLELSGNIID